MDPSELMASFRDLQSYVGWNAEDADRVAGLREVVAPDLGSLVDEFYDEIPRHPQAHRVMTGGAEQVRRLKLSLRSWLDELFSGPYDEQYVRRRWLVGSRHVEIGLDPSYPNAAFSLLRAGLTASVRRRWLGESSGMWPALQSLHKLLDLDSMLVQRAYGDQYARQMQRQERLAAIGQISGSIAHELRNPLNVIKTSIYCLTHGKSITEEKRSEHLQRMDRQVDVANGVISALSDFARLPTPSPDSVAVDQVVTEVLETLTIPAGVVVVRDIARDLVVAADRQQLAIVLSNLVRNGVEAMPHGGKLAISGRADAGGVSVSVIDTGVGIKPDRLGRLTEPLYTTKARGIGLGLAITRVIVERHRGTIRFSSEVDVGTEATVWMPSGAADAQDENQRRTE